MKKLFALFMVGSLCFPTFAVQEMEESAPPEETAEVTASATDAVQDTEESAPPEEAAEVTAPATDAVQDTEESAPPEEAAEATPLEEKEQPEPETVTLPADTDFDVELMEHLSGEYTLPGEKIPFRVMEDVIVEEHVVIAKGTCVSGRFGSAAKGKAMGRGGSIDFSIKETQAVDGTEVPLEGSISEKGKDKTGATVGMVVGFGLLGFLKKGGQGFAEKGTVYEAIVRRDTVVTIQDKTAETAEEDTGAEILEADFECVPGNLSFNLGNKKRTLSPVTVYLKRPTEDVKQVVLYQVNDYVLERPEPVLATGQERQRNGSLALQFERWDILRSLPNGESTLVFRGETTDGKIFEGSASITLALRAKK
jgi:hypothetical protein